MKLGTILNEDGRRGWLWMLLPVALWICLATIRSAAPPPELRGPIVGTLDVEPVLLDEGDPGRRRLGELRFLRGWKLASAERWFGGISAMQVEGGQVVAVSDTGVRFGFRLPRASGREPLLVAPLPHRAGDTKAGRDSEAMLLDGPYAWIAFERQNGVTRYRRDSWQAETGARPAAMRRWRANSGPEAMVRLADGRFLVFCEGRDDDSPFSPIVLFDGDPAVSGTPSAPLRYRRVPGLRVTDAALLPDGRLLLLNRRFSVLEGTSAALVVADPRGLRPGATLDGRVVAELAAPLTVDNMEALSVAREGGRTIVRIASDNNFMTLQRTLLLEFALEEGPDESARPPASGGP